MKPPEDILKNYNSLKGQFIITDSHTIERLVAVADDDFDYYYVTFNGRGLNFHTCVGRLIPLKGYLRDKDYNELVRLAKLNHSDFISPDIFEVGFEEWKDSVKYKFITSFYFTLDNNNKNNIT